MTARKLFIILVTVAALLVLYIIYGAFNNAPVIVIGNGASGAAETNAPDSGGKMGKIGTASVGTVTKAVYTDLDENKNVKREFGFERLLHESGNEWTLEKPYMNIIEKEFICGITADTGKVQVEMVAGKPVPKDAKLLGNVVIHLLPDRGAAMSESFIYLDDISFVSEKSLFTTDGPVRFVSADAEMAGKGLEVVYNTGGDRLELMHLVNLEYLRFKTFTESMFDKRSGTAKDDQAHAAAVPSGTHGEANAAGKQVEEQYYRCTLSKNVVINYGSQAVLADEVTISNLFWPKKKERANKKNTASATQAHDANGAAETIVPIVITCDSGIVVRPMEAMVSTAMEQQGVQRMLEFTGTPVTIKIEDAADSGDGVKASGSRILAECGWLKYNLDLGVLDMFSGNPPQNVLLNLEQGGSKLETTDSLRWSIKDRTAVIRGPGTLYLAAKNQSGGQNPDADKARMNFGGTMNVYFSDEPSQKSLPQTVSLKSIYLAGGFTAAMQNDKARLAADSATFNFAKDNAISQANLDGNVKFNSDSGSLRSQKAQVFFAKGNAVSQADFDGNVNFASSTGLLTSENAKVFFAKNSKGEMYASTVQNSGNVEIVPANVKGQTPQGVFRAQRIDYDVPKGYAVAKGPVELVFNDANGMPATITAQQKAEYFLISNEAVFEGDVKGKMARAGKQATEYAEFTGDKLVAKLGRTKQDTAEQSAAGSSDIEHLTITGDIVKFEAYQKQIESILGGIKLKCRQVDYDGKKNTIVAGGGSDCFVIIDNSKAPESARGGSLDFKGPCYARLWDFENLQWSMTEDRIIANGIPAGMHLTYLPISGGAHAKKVQIDARDVQVDLTQTPVGRKEVSALKATGGIHYLEESSYEFYGSQLLYDSSTSLMSIAGDPAKPCMVNGVIVDSIVYNLSNGSVKTQGLQGGAVPLPPKKAK